MQTAKRNPMDMTCDRPGIAEIEAGGKIAERNVDVGVVVTYVAHVVGGMVRVRFADGAEGVMHPHCFAGLR